MNRNSEPVGLKPNLQRGAAVGRVSTRRNGRDDASVGLKPDLRDRTVVGRVSTRYNALDDTPVGLKPDLRGCEGPVGQSGWKSAVLLAALLVCSAPMAHAFSGMGNPERGRMVFNQRCAVCHGEDGRGREGMAADFVGEWHRLTKPDQELSRNIRSGAVRTPGKLYSAGQCPPQMLDDRDMDDVLSHLRNAFGSPRLDFGR